MLKFLLVALTSFTVLSNSANAQLDYCELSERSIELNYFSHSYKNKNQLPDVLNLTTQLFSTLEMGDKIIISRHINGTVKLFESCKPGCPKKGLLEGLLDSTCSNEVAKRDQINFNNNIKKQIKSVVDATDVKFNIYDDFISFNKIKAKSDANEIIVFHSFVPYEVNIDAPETLDEFFVQTTQTQDLSDVLIPDLRYEGREQSALVFKLWSDLSLKGSPKGLSGAENSAN